MGNKENSTAGNHRVDSESASRGERVGRKEEDVVGRRKRDYKGRFKGRDLTGQRFELLTVLGLAVRGTHTSWNVRCDCGVIKQAMTENLTSGRTQSCGCRRKTVGATRRID